MSSSNSYGARANSGGKISFDHIHRPHFRNPSQQSSCLKKSKPEKIPISVLKNSIPYKSELCQLFKKKRCYYGEKCHFVHELSEIRQPELKPVAIEAHASERNGMGRERGRKCYSVAANGSGVVCPYGYGNRCLYLRKCDENLGRNHSGLMNSYRNAGDSSIEFRNHDKSILYRKTKLCDKWERFGSCPYEMSCIYAHGREALELKYIVEKNFCHDALYALFCFICTVFLQPFGNCWFIIFIIVLCISQLAMVVNLIFVMGIDVGEGKKIREWCRTKAVSCFLMLHYHTCDRARLVLSKIKRERREGRLQRMKDEREKDEDIGEIVSFEKDRRCVICLGEYKELKRVRIVRRKCNNCFHADCFQRWMYRDKETCRWLYKEKETCPTCNAPI